MNLPLDRASACVCIAALNRTSAKPKFTALDGVVSCLFTAARSLLTLPQRLLSSDPASHRRTLVCVAMSPNSHAHTCNVAPIGKDARVECAPGCGLTSRGPCIGIKGHLDRRGLFCRWPLQRGLP